MQSLRHHITLLPVIRDVRQIGSNSFFFHYKEVMAGALVLTIGLKLFGHNVPDPWV